MQIVSERKEVSSAGFTTSREFSMKAGAHLMSVLSGLYNNPEDAMVREYSTNMYDACLPLIAQGIAFRAPILRLPSKLNPTLEFQDFGIGMDFETVWKVYAEYGNSTKSGDNDSVGGFGLGSKTAFCYNDGAPWNIIATKDGVTNRFMAFIGENGVPNLTHLSTEQNGLPNGVTVSIPIRARDTQKIHDAARKYIPFFPIELVVENMDDVPSKPTYVVQSATGEWGITSESNGLTVVMGNVPYEVNLSEMFGWGNTNDPELRLIDSNDVVIHVPIGSVDIVPSRDSLKNTDRTRSAIRQMGKKMLKELPAAVTAKVVACATKWEQTVAEYEIAESIALPEQVRGQYSATGTMGMLKLNVPANVEVTKYAIDNSDKSTATVVSDVTEFILSPKVIRSGQPVTVIMINDGTKKQVSKVRYYIRDNFVSKTYGGNAARYGHTVSRVYLVTLPKGMTVDKFKTHLEGFPHVIMASSVITPVGVAAKVGQGVYKLNVYGSWEANAHIDATETEFYYLPLKKLSSGRGRYGNSRAQSLKQLANALGCDGSSGPLYGVRESMVDDLGPEWINLETIVEDSVTALLNANPVAVEARVSNARQESFKKAEFVSEYIPSSYLNQKDIASKLKAAVKTPSKGDAKIDMIVSSYGNAFSYDAEIRIKTLIVSIMAQIPVSPVSSLEVEAGQLIESSPLLKLAYMMKSHNYYLGGVHHIKGFLKDNL